MQVKDFQNSILHWFGQHGRKDLPWQVEVTPYRVWVSEIMLQQTQVNTVIPYYLKFMQHFPKVSDLASSSQDSVLHLWSGLGYYARARNLHKAAQIIAQHNSFPDSIDELLALPGIGRSTAGAILSIAFNDSHPILDGNVRRVLARFHAISGWPGTSKVKQQLWTLSETYTPKEQVADYTQAMMDLGATLCTRSKPNCSACPINTGCQALLQNRVGELPNAKPARKIPIKNTIFLVLKDAQQRFLLERRPATGIWGGLWCFPQFESVEAALMWSSEHHINIVEAQILPEQRHIFTHFQLYYTPVIIPTNKLINNVLEANTSIWYKAGENDKIGLPAPISRLLTQLI